VGETLTPVMFDVFSEELQKLAQGQILRRIGKYLSTTALRNPTRLSLKAVGKISRGKNGLFRGGAEGARRAFSPIKGLREGWEASTPLHGMEQRAKALGFGSASEAATSLKTTNPRAYKKLLGGGEHLLGTSPNAGKARSVAEELSRKGWTGAGNLTKYLPVGSKGMTVGFAGMGIPSVVNAQKATPTGEGGALEKGIGELGSAGGMILGSGLGIAPAMGLWYGATSLGSRLGRVLDRVRSGASVRTAVGAPSPSEAVEQLNTIQKYYG